VARRPSSWAPIPLVTTLPRPRSPPSAIHILLASLQCRALPLTHNSYCAITVIAESLELSKGSIARLTLKLLQGPMLASGAGLHATSTRALVIALSRRMMGPYCVRFAVRSQSVHGQVLVSSCRHALARQASSAELASAESSAHPLPVEASTEVPEDITMPDLAELSSGELRACDVRSVAHFCCRRGR
jgi:hypothetical protein